jgi:hypothetical protein
MLLPHGYEHIAHSAHNADGVRINNRTSEMTYHWRPQCIDSVARSRLGEARPFHFAIIAVVALPAASVAQPYVDEWVSPSVVQILAPGAAHRHE